MDQPNDVNVLIREFVGNNWYPPRTNSDSLIFQFDISWDWIMPVWNKLYVLGFSKLFQNDIDFKMLLFQTENELVAGNLEEFVKRIVLCIEYYKSLT
jgi:hypothetical protein